MRAMVFGIAATLLANAAAVGQDSPAGSGGLSSPAVKAGMTREELIRSWDLDGDGTISRSEADVARARMRRQRSEMLLDSGIDPVTGLPRHAGDGLPKPAPEPLERLLPDVPADVPAESTDDADTESRRGTRPKPLSELLAPLTAPDPVPGLPRMPSLTGKKESPDSKPVAERSGRASWLPPSKTGTAGIGGPRANAPPAVSGYGSSAWSDLNAGRFRAAQGGAEHSTTSSGRSATTGGGLLPTVRKPGQTGALILPGQTPSRPSMLSPAAPGAPRLPTVSPPRISAEDIGGYGP